MTAGDNSGCSHSAQMSLDLKDPASCPACPSGFFLPSCLATGALRLPTPWAKDTADVGGLADMLLEVLLVTSPGGRDLDTPLSSAGWEQLSPRGCESSLILAGQPQDPV